MKPMKNYKPGTQDSCQTPPDAVIPLADYVDSGMTVWECASDQGYLAWGIRRYLRCEVIMTDIQYEERLDFFKYRPSMPVDYIITNPPYSLKYKWLERCYELEIPFALLMPVYTLGAKTAQRMFDKHGIEVLFLDKRINFKMPHKGWDGQAQFSTAWFCWNILPKQMLFGKLSELHQNWRVEFYDEKYDGAY